MDLRSGMEPFNKTISTGVPASITNCEGCQFGDKHPMCMLVKLITGKVLKNQLLNDPVSRAMALANIGEVIDTTLEKEIFNTKIEGTINKDCPVFVPPTV